MNISEIVNYVPRNLTFSDLLNPETTDQETSTPAKIFQAQNKRNWEGSRRTRATKRKRHISYKIKNRECYIAVQKLFEGKIQFSQFIANFGNEFEFPENLFDAICHFSDIGHLNKIDLRFYSDLSEHTKICKSQISFHLINNLVSHAVNLNEIVFGKKSLGQMSRSFSTHYLSQKETVKSLSARVKKISCNEAIPTLLKKNIYNHFPNARFTYLGR